MLQNTDSIKNCVTCGVDKDTTEFHKHKQQVDGLHKQCKSCRSEYSKRSYNAEASRGNKLLKAYGLTLSQYDELLDSQRNRCAICDTDNPKGHNGRFHVDHKHLTGEIRGLLCHSCNVSLGGFRDSISVLAKAIQYLNEKGSYGEDSGT